MSQELNLSLFRPFSFDPLDRPLSSFKTVHFNPLSRLFMKNDRPVLTLRTIYFNPWRPSTFIQKYLSGPSSFDPSDRPVWLQKTVQFSPLGPSTLTTTLGPSSLTQDRPLKSWPSVVSLNWPLTDSAEVYIWISRYTILPIRGSGLCFFVGKKQKKYIPNRIKSHLIKKKNFRFGRPNSPDPGAKKVGPGLKIG